ncbi:MAG: hypothetical protein UZ05_CHB002001646 [Chlorobi bacterium OLB5]|nr:MAG: hypothetical protein UZ05_CHB002001646 [Chlorobi bacterium OLB5]
MKSKFNVILSSNITFGNAIFNSDRYITEITGNDTSIVNVKNNKLPYAPDISFNSSVEIKSPFGAD